MDVRHPTLYLLELYFLAWQMQIGQPAYWRLWKKRSPTSPCDPASVCLTHANTQAAAVQPVELGDGPPSSSPAEQQPSTMSIHVSGPAGYLLYGRGVAGFAQRVSVWPSRMSSGRTCHAVPDVESPAAPLKVNDAATFPA